MSVEKIQFSLKSDKNNRHATRKPTYIYGNISLTLLRMRKTQIEIVGKIKTHFYFQYIFSESRAAGRNNDGTPNGDSCLS